MERQAFEDLVSMAILALPEEFLERLDNIDIIVSDAPTLMQLRKGGAGNSGTLLGLYEGVPQTKRTSGYSMVMPDKITIFQRSIEAQCHTEEDIVAEIEHVVKHEIAHHFGISDSRLRYLGKY